MSKLPPNTRIHSNGHIEFRKRYKGGQFIRTWPIEQKEKAFREIYDLLLRMSKHDDFVVEREHRMAIEEACDTYLRIHGPNRKGGVSTKSTSPYYNLACHLKIIKATWSGRFYDTITKYDVRDLLKRCKTASTSLKYLGILTHMYRSFQSWNEEGNVLKTKVKIPSMNPAVKWRAQMKSSQKKELPRTRVLTPGEWNQLKAHMKPRTLAICEIALKRFLRLADIRQISRMMIKGEIIEGLQQKTGEKFMVPVLANQPTSYDFTNFKREFKVGLVAAAMDYPVNHPMHFTVRDLRRTGATWAYHKTKDMRSIQRMLGHTKMSTTERYLNVSDENLQGIAQVVDEIADSSPVSSVG